MMTIIKLPRDKDVECRTALVKVVSRVQINAAVWRGRWGREDSPLYSDVKLYLVLPVYDVLA